MFVHVSLLPVVGSAGSGEQKTKPTQHSVKELRSLGLSPDLIVCRSTGKIDAGTKAKISTFCHVPQTHVLSVHDVSNIYHVPLILVSKQASEILYGQDRDAFELTQPLSSPLSSPLLSSPLLSSLLSTPLLLSSPLIFPPLPFPSLISSLLTHTAQVEQNIHSLIKQQLQLPTMTDMPILAQWESMATVVDNPTLSVSIAIVGKYTVQQQGGDAYLSVAKAIKHASIHMKVSQGQGQG